ncbi:MAG: 4-(cytidine 5'-diphospho)-2-C-methyl-D-erythritol kinase [Pseudomonadota bacterium]
MICRAKVNLTLHVGAAIPSGPQAGYHPVESLVVFADFGDALTFEKADTTSLSVEGPFGHRLDAGADNLILKTMALCAAPPQRVCLMKNLPVSAGLGGGSANAAAILRRFDSERGVHDASIGADVPVCRLSRTAMMEGIGEHVTPLPGLGQVSAILVNPGVPVSTATIFSRFDAQNHSTRSAKTAQTGSLLTRALSGGNDLQSTAIACTPVIEDVIQSVERQPGCQLARMSGSGASVFGLFDHHEAAQSAAAALTARGWWAVATRLGDPS